MKSALLLPSALLALLATAALAQTGQTGQTAPAPAAPAATPSPAATSPAPAAPTTAPFIVYLTDEKKDVPETAAAPPAALPTTRVGDPSPTTLVLLAGGFLLGAFAWLRLRTPSCPRCATKVSRLSRTAEDASLLAAGGRQVSGTAPGATACLACGEVVRPLFLSWMTADRRCPDCRQPTKKVKLEQLERSGYLTWGVVQIDADCLSCSYRSSEIYPSPPLEAPLAKRGLSRV